MIHNSSSSMTDARGVETRKAAILSDAAMPAAPMRMPEQVIETDHAKAARASGGRIGALVALLSLGFGRAARGR
ncbi:MAG: hypothetical protein Q4P24_05275 [Rhodobacterales bacterium]|nr:hypothetical protein [Rhodobacterales bacterium]